MNVRVNSKEYKPDVSASGIWEMTFPLYLHGSKMWLEHTDDNVDVTLMPIVNTDEARILDQEVTSLRLDDFATPDETVKYHIGIGRSIISAG